jgi:hypothetical protein
MSAELFPAQAQIDSASRFDMISWNIVQGKFPTLWKSFPADQKVESDLINNTRVEFVGTLEAEWHGENKSSKKFAGRFRAKTHRSTFFVCKDLDMPCDVILGQDTINQCRLFKPFHFSAAGGDEHDKQSWRVIHKYRVKSKYCMTRFSQFAAHSS